jgi:uncharacterized protein YjgD (DUF1641 family)
MDANFILEAVETRTINQDLALLHSKLDRLTDQLEEQRKQSETWEELRRDLTPVINGMVRLTINELDDVGSDFELDDILYLVKRLLRDIHMLTGMLDQLESLAELGKEARLMSRPVFDNLVMTLQMLENKGYFVFANGLVDITDRIVTSFGQEDLKALGDNIVTILTTVKNMTQPEIMALANNAVHRMEEPLDENISAWTLIKEMGDPEVRKGFARLIHVVKGLANQPDSNGSH